jgi:hypothetical protein
MGIRRLALLVAASLCLSSPSFAQPAEGEIEMEGDPPPAPPPAPDPTPAPPAEQPTAEPPADQPPPVVKDPKVAKQWLRAAEQLVRKGDYMTRKNQPEAKTQYENAVTAYKKAIEASDDVGLNYQLAIAEDKAGMTPDAIVHLKLVLAAQGVKPAIMKNAQARLDEFSMKVGVVMLTITPPGTQIMIEGKEVGEAPLTEALLLMPGMHKVSLTAVGFQPKEVELKVEAGSESERTIALEPVPVVNKPTIEEPGPTPPEALQPTGPNLMPIYIGGGAAAGLFLIGTVTGIVAVAKHGTYTGNVTASERADARSSGKTFALVTDLCFVGMLGAAAFTAYWYQYKYRPQARAFAERQQQAKVDVVPWVQPDAGGLSVSGSF